MKTIRSDMMKKYLKPFAAAFMALCFTFGSAPAVFADNLYGEKTEETVTKGVVYGYEHRLTTDG